MRNGVLISLGTGALVAGLVTAFSLSGVGRGDVETLQAKIASAEAASTEAYKAASAAQENTQTFEEVLARAEQTAAAHNPSAPVRDTAYGVGRPAHTVEIAAWDIDVLPDGRGLPEGRGDVWTGGLCGTLRVLSWRFRRRRGQLASISRWTGHLGRQRSC